MNTIKLKDNLAESQPERAVVVCDGSKSSVAPIACLWLAIQCRASFVPLAAPVASYCTHMDKFVVIRAEG